MLLKPDRKSVQRLVEMALLEDAPWGDLTSQTFVPAEAQMRARLTAREGGVFCGEDVIAIAMASAGKVETTFAIHDGEAFEAGAIIAECSGPAQAILQAERVALNFAQRLSGIATLTAKYVAATAGTRAKIVDTRKTTPGLRLLERYAVRCGGGHNHRFSLSDAVMLKDNHLAALAPNDGSDLAETIRKARMQLPHTTHVEIEVDCLDQVPMALSAGADTILLDNFSIEHLKCAVEQINGRTITEASGGVTLDRIPEIAATGVDLISVGALTHSVRALDLGLDI
ncbi:MAG: carboxylating nicotinate-nucleotide diphosphorylase [Acidobacteria bacterium]|nr:carboxylating nicotinate-nucleotide diphosphorylase [Acidobacteriota bacterium]